MTQKIGSPIRCAHGKSRKSHFSLATLLAVFTLGGCVAPQPYDYAAFKAAKPASLLVLPPINDTPDVKATYSVLAQTTMPLSEAGYYVFPVALVDETFKENGLTMAPDIHAVSIEKLRTIFGADAVVYMTVKKYGTVYAILASESRVEITGKVVDLKSGTLLWEGIAAASTSEQSGGSQAGLAGLLIQALVTQILNSATDASHPMAGLANARLFTPRPINGILHGPRSPNYLKD